MSRIELTDSDEAIARKIQRATTDPAPLPDNEAALKERPEARNLIGLLAALSSEETEAILSRIGGGGFSDLKAELIARLQSEIAPLRRAIAERLAHPERLDALLKDGAERARAKARPILEETKEAVGLLLPR